MLHNLLVYGFQNMVMTLISTLKMNIQTNIKCDCGDPDCKREVKGTKEGKLYVINHFTCGKTKKIMKENAK